ASATKVSATEVWRTRSCAMLNAVGRTPWSARVPLDPLLVRNQFPAEREWPARGPAADQGVRPIINSGARKAGKACGMNMFSCLAVIVTAASLNAQSTRPFSHRLHLQLKLECTACHTAAPKSTSAQDNL